MQIDRRKAGYFIAFSFLLSSTYIFGFINGFDFIQKAIILLLSLFGGIFYGLSKKRIKLIFFFTIPVLLSLFSGIILNKNVDLVLVSKSYLSFLTIFLIFAISLPKSHFDSILEAIIYLPYFSLFIGCIGIFWGWEPWNVEYTGAFRLRGAVIAAHLAMLGVVSVYAILYKLNHEKRKKYYILLFLSILIVALTATRGGLIAIAIVIIPYLFNILKKLDFVKLIGVLLSLSIFGVYIAKVLSIRNAQAMESEEFNASGRLVAWQFFYEKALEYPFMGWGLGSVTKLTENEIENNLSAFVVPHNEFVRFSVDLGFFGAFIFLFLMILYLFKMGKFVKSKDYILYIFMLFSFLVYACVDNLLSTFQYAIPFFLLLNIMLSSMKKGVLSD